MVFFVFDIEYYDAILYFLHTFLIILARNLRILSNIRVLGNWYLVQIQFHEFPLVAVSSPTLYRLHQLLTWRCKLYFLNNLFDLQECNQNETKVNLIMQKNFVLRRFESAGAVRNCTTAVYLGCLQRRRTLRIPSFSIESIEWNNRNVNHVLYIIQYISTRGDVVRHCHKSRVLKSFTK